MGTTSNGIPYPEDTDPTAQGAQAIKAVATQLNPVGRVAVGTASVNVNGVASNSAAITFPAGRFTAAPAVVAVTGAAAWIAGAAGVSATGFSLQARSYNNTNGGGPLACYYAAFGI